MTDKKHIHYDKIMEWAADPSGVWQFKYLAGWNDIKQGDAPDWTEDTEYRRKPRWFDLEQEWIAKGKPPVEMLFMNGEWREVDPRWVETSEYRFAIVSRHAALKAEWEAKGRPQLQYKWMSLPDWEDLPTGLCTWLGECEYRIKPTPHPDADVLRALAEDGSLDVCISVYNGELSFTSTGQTK